MQNAGVNSPAVPLEEVSLGDFLSVANCAKFDLPEIIIMPPRDLSERIISKHRRPIHLRAGSRENLQKPDANGW
jgi:hypothetical protein